MTFTEAASGNPVILAHDGELLVVYDDARLRRTEIFFQKSTDHGTSWIPEVRVTANDNLYSGCPVIAVLNGAYHTTFDDASAYYYASAYHYASYDGGMIWDAMGFCVNDNADAGDTALVAHKGEIHITYTQVTGYFEFDVFYKHTRDGGENWSSARELSVDNGGYSAILADIAANTNGLFVAYSDNRSGSSQIMFRRSLDGGNTWKSEIQLSQASTYAELVAICATEDTVHVAWDQGDSSGSDMFYTRSNDQGVSFSTPRQVSFGDGDAKWCDIAAYGGGVHIVWVDNRSGTDDIYYVRSTNNGQTWMTEIPLVAVGYDCDHPIVAADANGVYVVWEDSRHGNTEIYFIRDHGVEPTPTLTPTPSPSSTPTQTPTATDSPTSTPSKTPIPSRTPTSTITASPTPSDTPYFSSTPTETPTATLTHSPTPTPIKPIVLLGGYWDTRLSSTDGGTLTILAMSTIEGGSIHSVELFYAGQPTGIQLYDDGMHKDLAAGDGVYGYVIFLAPGAIGQPATFTLEISAKSSLGARSDPFPYLSVH